MTVRITPTGLTAGRFMSSGSRYLKQNVIHWGESKRICFDTYIKEPYKKTGSERVMLLDAGNQYRPDLVSFEIYGYVDNWWRILEANNMKDIWEFKAGTTIILPIIGR